jgi:hypothetical protein
MNKTFLYLDDCRNIEPPENYNLVIVRSFNAFVNYIELEGLPDVISFDHDLADEHTSDYVCDDNWNVPNSEIILKYDEYKEKTGYDAAKWLVNHIMETNKSIPQCYVHSCNPVGVENILKYLNNYSANFENWSCCTKEILKHEIKNNTSY